MKNILLVSDNQELIQNLETIVTFMGESCQSRGFSDCERYLQDSGADAVLIEHISPAIVSGLVEKFPHIPFVALVENNSQASAGCNLVSVIATPLTYPVLTQAIHRCQEYSRRKPSLSRTSGTKTRLFRSLIGKSEQIQIVRRLVEQVAPTDATVLILGESGTGKEVVARNVHFLSERKDGPFIPVNCGAIPGELLESELFGHEKGAFTGASSRYLGRFEQADQGTLFLDEIGDMPLDTQTRLLRVLSEGSFYRVGGTQPVRANVRVVAATHQNLAELVKKGSFREDLFHRINVIRIQLPELQQRLSDIPLLAAQFLSEAAKELETEPKQLTREAERRLMQYSWPGNVRQLENVCRWLMVMSSGREILESDLPPEIKHQTIPSDDTDNTQAAGKNWQSEFKHQLMQQIQQGDDQALQRVQDELEQMLIDLALTMSDGHKQDAAKLLGWGRNTITRKQKKYSA